MVRAILFDVVGTTVVETAPVISEAFYKAFQDHGLRIDERSVRSNRGRDKQEMIELLLLQHGFENTLAPVIYQSFIKNVEDRLHQFRAGDGAPEIFDRLKERGIRIGLGTGLSRDLFEKIMLRLEWPLSRFDYIGIPENGIRARPHPDMILDMMSKLGIAPAGLIKVGDTVADIQEGKAAGVVTIAILAGTQSREDLINAEPDFAINNLGQIMNIIKQSAAIKK